MTTRPRPSAWKKQAAYIGACCLLMAAAWIAANKLEIRLKQDCSDTLAAIIPAPEKYIARVYWRTCSDGLFVTIATTFVTLDSQTAQDAPIDRGPAILEADVGIRDVDLPVVTWQSDGNLVISLPDSSYVFGYSQRFDQMRVDLVFRERAG